MMPLNIIRYRHSSTGVIVAVDPQLQKVQLNGTVLGPFPAYDFKRTTQAMLEQGWTQDDPRWIQAAEAWRKLCTIEIDPPEDDESEAVSLEAHFGWTWK
jgi:hypothetical protein